MKLNGEPTSSNTDASLTELLKPMVDALEMDQAASAKVDQDGWSGAVVRVDGEVGPHYLAWLDETRSNPSAANLRTLSARQREVAEHAIAGATAREIAERLHISVHTVRDHIKSIYRRLEVGSRLELAEYVREAQRRP